MITAYEATDPSLFRTPLDIISQDVTGTGTRGQPILGPALERGHIRALVRLLTVTSGREMEICRQLVPTATHLVVTRYNPLLTSHNRLRLTRLGVERWFNIGYVDDVDEQHAEMRVIATEEVPADQG